MERKNRRLSRRDFLILSAIGLGGAYLGLRHPTAANARLLDSTPERIDKTATLNNPNINIEGSQKITEAASPLPSSTPTEIKVSPTPEIPFGEHPEVLPLEVPFIITRAHKERLDDKRRHMGIDLGGPEVKEGVDLLSISDCELIYAGFAGSLSEKPEKGLSLGNVVVLKDVSTGNYFLFAHLSKIIDKAPGEKILAGEKIGEIGHSGNWEKKRDHLHFMVFTPYGWSLIEQGTNNFYGGDYGRSLTGYYVNLQYINDEDADKRLINPVDFILEKTGIKIW